jgi:hypothetical protein
MEGVHLKVADTQEELEAAYRLVHDVYVQEGYAEPHPSGLRVNLRYALPTTATFVAKAADEVLMTQTLIGDSPLGVPMDMIFSAELYELRRQGRYIAEVGAFASHPEFRGRKQVVGMYTNKIMWSYAIRNLGADDLVIAVNPKHEWVYKHLLLFERINRGVRRYAYVNDAPAIAMRLDLRSCERRWRRTWNGMPPHRNIWSFFLTAEPDKITLPNIREPYNVWDEPMFNYFFEEMTDPRREGAGSLLDLYRVLYTLPSSRSERPAVPMVLDTVAAGAAAKGR